MIRVVKAALRKVVGKAKLNYDELQTVLIEIESMINSRPLTYMSDENNGQSFDAISFVIWA